MTKPGAAISDERIKRVLVWVFYGLAVIVLTCVLLVSGDYLHKCAEAVKITGLMSWTLPVALDAGGIGGALCGFISHGRTRIWAWSIAAANLAGSVTGNMVGHLLEANQITATTWMTILASVVYPAEIAAMTHLGLALWTDRTAPEPRVETGTVRSEPVPEPRFETGPVSEPEPQPEPAPPAVPASPTPPHSVPALTAPPPASPREPDRGTHADQPEPTDSAPDRTDTELLTLIRKETDRTGKPPSQNWVKRELNVGTNRAARLLSQLNQPTSRTADRSQPTLRAVRGAP